MLRFKQALVAGVLAIDTEVQACVAEVLASVAMVLAFDTGEVGQ